MITAEQKLKLQAYLDNELSEAEAQKVAAWIERDPEARSLGAELRYISKLLEVGEPAVRVPESREFYWSKIQREINRASAAPAARVTTVRPWWVRFAAPALGAALVCLLGVSLLRTPNSPSPMHYLSEIETPLNDTSAITFHSEAAAMTVVWVQSR